jgi:transposase
MNQPQAVAMNEGYRWKKKLFSQQGRALLEKLSLAPWPSRRRKELLELLDQLDPKIRELTAAAQQEAQQRPEVLRLMTHPGVGPITGLAYVQVIGTPDRFSCGKRSAATLDSSRARRPVPASNDWGTSASRAIYCCATCWEKPRKRRRGVTPTGGDGICTWRCVDTRTLPKRRWPGNSVFACTG